MASSTDVSSHTSSDHSGRQQTANHERNQTTEGSGGPNSSAGSEVRYVHIQGRGMVYILEI
jgi:hypothetical protein